MDDLHRNLIDGEWVDGEAVPNINPSNTDEVVGQYARATLQDTHRAIAAAKAAFPAWSRSGILERHSILTKASQEILARKDELGALLSREEGKTLPEGTGEVVRAAAIFDFFAGEALRLIGETVPSVRPGVGVEITREAVGVVGIITPWNFPIAIPTWKIAPALVYGNTIVFKPADLVPGSSWAIVDILHRAGLPKGVLNLVMGVPLKVSAGTSGFILSLVDSSAAWIYLNQGAVLPIIAAPSVIGMMLGARIGARILHVVKASVIRNLVIALLLFAGLRALLKGLGVWN